jgi:hypothetical protein
MRYINVWLKREDGYHNLIAIWPDKDATLEFQNVANNLMIQVGDSRIYYGIDIVDRVEVCEVVFDTEDDLVANFWWC